MQPKFKTKSKLPVCELAIPDHSTQSVTVETIHLFYYLRIEGVGFTVKLGKL